MILVVAEFTIPLLGFLALNKFLCSDGLEHQKRKMLKLSYYIVASVTLFFAPAANNAQRNLSAARGKQTASFLP